MLKYYIIFPVLNASSDLKYIFDGIRLQKGLNRKDVFFIDSSSIDDTVTKLKKNQYNKIFPIERNEFNHGGTRQMAAEMCQDADILIYMTQDAYLASPESVNNILKFFDDSKVSAVCGRQLPHKNANPLARHARVFNYPEKTEIKDESDISKQGIKVPFISNSFSAYRRSVLMEVGGFPADTILSEDMYVAAKMVLAGYKIVYSGEATCYHSHNYTPLSEFKRYFDIGVFHAREPWIRENFGGAGDEGLRFVKSELKYVWPNFYWLCRSCVTSALKLVGYKLGQKERWMPLWLKKKLSMHHRFWDKFG